MTFIWAVPKTRVPFCYRKLVFGDSREAVYFKQSAKDSCNPIRVLMGTPNREAQEYSIIEYKGPGRYIPMILLLYSWGPYLGFPVKAL